MSDTELRQKFLEAFDLPEIPPIRFNEGDIVAVIISYNEALRFPYFLEFYRKIGVSHFLVVDNGSTDGSAEFLDKQPDVTRLLSTKPYKDYKSIWRSLLGDIYLTGHWVIFPDVDELFVYPGWPDLPLSSLVKHWENAGIEGVFTSMVDMYSDTPLAELNYQLGQSFLDVCPYFDGDGYRYMRNPGRTKTYQTPKWHLYGGARERLFYAPRKRTPNSVDKWILRHFFGIHPEKNPLLAGRTLQKFARQVVRGSLPKPTPLMSKVPLVRWRQGLRYSGGVHNLADFIRLAPDWCALLHFKYLDDFETKTESAVSRG